MPASLLLSGVGDSEVINTTTETSVFSGTVPGGTLGTDTPIIMRMIGDVLNNSGIAATFTLRIKFGGVTIHTFPSISLATGVTRYADISLMFLTAENSVTAQRSAFEHKQGGTDSATGGVGNGNDHNLSVNSAIAVNSAVDQTLEITAQLGAAHANLAWRRRGVWVEHVGHGPAAAPGAGTDMFVMYVPPSGVGTVSNTASETSVATITIPGGTIGTNNLVIVRPIGDVRNFTGSNARWTARAYYGGTSIFFGGATGTINASASKRRAFPTEFWIGGAGATNAQRIGVMGHVLSSFDGSGEGDLGTTGWQANQSSNAIAVDSTVDQDFELRVDFDVASPDLDYRLDSLTASVVKAA